MSLPCSRLSASTLGLTAVVTPLRARPPVGLRCHIGHLAEAPLDPPRRTRCTCRLHCVVEVGVGHHPGCKGLFSGAGATIFSGLGATISRAQGPPFSQGLVPSFSWGLGPPLSRALGPPRTRRRGGPSSGLTHAPWHFNTGRERSECECELRPLEKVAGGARAKGKVPNMLSGALA